MDEASKAVADANRNVRFRGLPGDVKDASGYIMLRNALFVGFSLQDTLAAPAHVQRMAYAAAEPRLFSPASSLGI